MARVLYRETQEHALIAGATALDARQFDVKGPWGKTITEDDLMNPSLIKGRYKGNDFMLGELDPKGEVIIIDVKRGLAQVIDLDVLQDIVGREDFVMFLVSEQPRGRILWGLRKTNEKYHESIQTLLLEAIKKYDAYFELDRDENYYKHRSFDLHVKDANRATKLHVIIPGADLFAVYQTLNAKI
jgi:hypothetical protein